MKSADLSRRSFVAAAGVGALTAFGLSGCSNESKGYSDYLVSPYEGKIADVHSHALNQDYFDLLARHDALLEEGVPLPQWNAEELLEHMEKGSINWTLLSLASPHPYYGDLQESVDFCRSFNQFLADQKNSSPDKLGFCAILPLPDVEAAITEAIFALDELGANGIKVGSNGRGQYLGLPELDPLFEVLNDKEAALIIHPERPIPQQEDIFTAGPVPLYEFLADTTRAVLNMVARDVPVRYPNVKIVVPHCGSFLPNVANRMSELQHILVKAGAMEEIDVKENFSRLYYDTAGTPVPYMLKLLLTITTPDHVMYGGDYPFTTSEYILGALEEIKDFMAKDPDLAYHMEEIFYTNAQTVFMK